MLKLSSSGRPYNNVKMKLNQQSQRCANTDCVILGVIVAFLTEQSWISWAQFKAFM